MINKLKGLISFKETRSFSKKLFPIFSITFLVIGLSFGIYMYMKDRPHVNAEALLKDMGTIVEIFNTIDKECNILSIKGEKNPINFFTVKDFSGSIVGPLNLAHKENWQGPYLEKNLEFKGQLYDIVQAKDGYYVLPGDGVILPNGKIIGKDIIINKEITIDPELIEKLTYIGKIFITKLTFKIGDWDMTPKQKKRLKILNVSIKELNESIPYTYNSTSMESNV